MQTGTGDVLLALGILNFLFLSRLIGGITRPLCTLGAVAYEWGSVVGCVNGSMVATVPAV